MRKSAKTGNARNTSHDDRMYCIFQVKSNHLHFGSSAFDAIVDGIDRPKSASAEASSKHDVSIRYEAKMSVSEVGATAEALKKGS